MVGSRRRTDIELVRDGRRASPAEVQDQVQHRVGSCRNVLPGNHEVRVLLDPLACIGVDEVALTRVFE